MVCSNILHISRITTPFPLTKSQYQYCLEFSRIESGILLQPIMRIRICGYTKLKSFVGCALIHFDCMEIWFGCHLLPNPHALEGGPQSSIPIKMRNVTRQRGEEGEAAPSSISAIYTVYVYFDFDYPTWHEHQHQRQCHQKDDHQRTRIRRMRKKPTTAAVTVSKLQAE